MEKLEKPIGNELPWYFTGNISIWKIL